MYIKTEGDNVLTVPEQLNSALLRLKLKKNNNKMMLLGYRTPI